MLPRRAQAAIEQIISAATGRWPLSRVSYEHRPLALAMLCDATGVRIEVLDRALTVLNEEGALASGMSIGSSAVMQTAARIDNWCKQRHPQFDALMPLGWPSGAASIIERLGYDARSVLCFVQVAGAVDFTNGERSIEVAGYSNHGIEVTYQAPNIIWKNGMVSIRNTILPRTVAMALKDQPLGRLVDDPLIADNVIRHVSCDEVRDRWQRLTTHHAKRTKSAYEVSG